MMRIVCLLVLTGCTAELGNGDHAPCSDAGRAPRSDTGPVAREDAGPGLDAGVDAGAAPDAGDPEPLPLVDGSDIIRDLAAERPDLLAGSCVEMGGNNDFLFEAVRRLRRRDARFGLNWKRGNIGDMSQDVVDYHFGFGEPENSTDVYIIDVIGGHCGPTPAPAWIDVTEATREGGTIGRWTLAGRTDLGP
jgi:hypothetical protein